MTSTKMGMVGLGVGFWLGCRICMRPSQRARHLGWDAVASGQANVPVTTAQVRDATHDSTAGLGSSSFLSHIILNGEFPDFTKGWYENVGLPILVRGRRGKQQGGVGPPSPPFDTGKTGRCTGMRLRYWAFLPTACRPALLPYLHLPTRLLVASTHLL